MPYIKYESLAITATTSSGVDNNTAGTYNGLLHAIRYTPSTSAATSTGGNLTITGAKTGITLFVLEDLGSTSLGTYYPRYATVLSTDAVTASTGSALAPIHNERLNVVISSGSTAGTKAGTLEFFIV